jgi:repressor LexA
MDAADRVTVPGHLLHPRGGDHYVLRVVGDSMDDEGIFDGDFVIVLRREVAEPGEMVVVLYGDEASIKRYYPVNEHEVQLQPGNKKLPPITIPASEVRVQGIVVGIMRKF